MEVKYWQIFADLFNFSENLTSQTGILHTNMYSDETVLVRNREKLGNVQLAEIEQQQSQ